MTKRNILARFGFVRKDLNEALERVTDDKLQFALRPGMPTIRELLFEIAGTEKQIVTFIRHGTRIRLRETTEPWEGIWTVAEVREILAQVRKETLEYFDSLTDADLAQPRQFPVEWFESLGLPEVPLYEALSSLAAHEWYHVGQLVSYLWASGEDPTQW